MKNLLIGNGVNIQHGGYDFGNAAIILRTLKCFKDVNFPTHILTNDPIEAKCYIGYLFLEIKRVLAGKYDQYTNCTTERYYIAQISLTPFVYSGMELGREKFWKCQGDRIC